MDNKGEKRKTNTEWISFASVISCIAVVFLHTNGCFWTFSTGRYWFTANIIESVFYFAVPCFFMITGATLMDYRERYSLNSYFVKRIKKTLIPFVVWSFVGIAYHLMVGDVQPTEIDLKYVWNGIINTTVVPYYWYFTALFGVYLSIPIFASVNKQYRKEVFSYAAITGFVLGGVLPLLKATLFIDYGWTINIAVASGYLLFTIIGYLIYTCDISMQKRIFIYAFAILGLGVHIIGTYRLSMSAGEIVTTFKGYNNAPCILYSVGIMVCMKYSWEILAKVKPLRMLINAIKPYTLSIYLLQYFIISLMIKVFDINTTSIIYRCGAPFIVISIAIIITYVIRKIPFVRAVLP